MMMRESPVGQNPGYKLDFGFLHRNGVVLLPVGYTLIQDAALGLIRVGLQI